MARNNKISIAIVDDHEIACQGLSNILSSELDMEVIGCAANSADAVTIIRNQSVDLALVDIRLGNESGFDVVPMLIKEKPGLKILMLTGFENEFYVSKAFESEASGLVTKDSPKALISNAIRTVMAGGSVWPKHLLLDVFHSACRMTYQPQSQPGHSIKLTPREKEIISLLVQGDTNKAIAQQLGLSEVTIKKSLNNIMHKFHVDNRVKLATAISRLGLDE